MGRALDEDNSRVQAPPRDVAGQRGSRREESDELSIKSCQLRKEVAGPCREAAERGHQMSSKIGSSGWQPSPRKDTAVG